MSMTLEQLAKDVDGISEAIRIYCDAIDAATTQLRKNLGTAPQEFKHSSIPPQSRLAYDVSKIVWNEARGDKGMFLLAIENEQATDENKQNFKALIEELRTTRKSIFTKTDIIWLMRDGLSIGRKLKEAKQ
jgi:hypothetical protein